MTVTDDVLQANQRYAQTFDLAGLPRPPARKLAIVTCMDARMVLERMLGLKAGDANIIRNAGGIVTEDVLRSLIISHELLGTEEFLVINHTDCGLQNLAENELRARLRARTGREAEQPGHFHAFADLQENVREQVRRVRSHPWLPEQISVRGFVYDVKTGRLREVAA